MARRVTKAAAPSRAKVYENVRIQILGPVVADEHRATVAIRDGEMVLDVSDPGIGPYLIRGKLVGSYYAGKDEVRDGKQVDLVARWCLLGDVWVGWWLEEGEEFLFSFRLPKR